MKNKAHYVYMWLNDSFDDDNDDYDDYDSDKVHMSVLN